MRSFIRNAILAGVAALGISVTAASAQDVNQYHGVTNLVTFWDIQETFGTVPAFFEMFPENRLPMAWDSYKAIHVNQDTALDAKTKHLIGIAVAAQAACESCIYFQTSAAFANGASFQEVQEAVNVYVSGNEWSKVLDADSFQTVKEDTDALVASGVLVAQPAIN